MIEPDALLDLNARDLVLALLTRDEVTLAGRSEDFAMLVLAMNRLVQLADEIVYETGPDFEDWEDVVAQYRRLRERRRWNHKNETA